MADVVARLTAALEPDEVVLGGGNAKKLKKLPPGCRAGDNANAFLGGFLLWEKDGSLKGWVLAAKKCKSYNIWGSKLKWNLRDDPPEVPPCATEHVPYLFGWTQGVLKL